MANYTIYIDETGSFSFRNRGSFIGGWICKSDDVKQIKSILRASVTYFNNYLTSNNIQNIILDYPSHLHFMPLHLSELRKSKDNNISVDPGDINIFFTNFFDSIKNVTLQVFRSTGKPVFMPNEQATYIDILRNTLLQLIDQSILSSQTMILDIVIAHRRTPSLYGEEGYTDTLAYERHIIDGLTNELQDAFVSNKPQLNITFSDARYEPGLITADFFCGALRKGPWTKYNYLEDFKEVMKFSFSKGYKRIGSRMVQKLRHFQEIDSPAAAIQCVDVLSANPLNDEMRSLLDSILRRMKTNDKSIFCSSIINLLHERLENDPERYSHLESMNELINILDSTLSNNYDTMTQMELQLFAALRINKILIDSHLGKTSCTDINHFLSFLDDIGEIAFDNQMLIMQQRIDAVLMGVQITAFNTFKFDQIEDILKDITSRYYSMFKDEFEENGVKDKNLARLEGTLGQMYGLQYDLEKDKYYFEMAEICLKKDINACITNSASWEQGMGYLTTLYWKHNDFEKCINQFLNESGAVDEDRDAIFDLNNINDFRGGDKPFIQLHRLYLCALATKNNVSIKGLITAKEYLLKNHNIHQYPYILSAKWISILFIIIGDFKNAIDILDSALAKKERDEMTIDVIRIPLKLLHHSCLKKIGRNSNYSCQNEVRAIREQEEDIAKVLENLGIEKYYQDESDWSAYEIGRLLPFYFS